MERDYLVNLSLKGSGVDEEPMDVLSINRNGDILVHKQVNYEVYRTLLLSFEARDNTNKVDTKLGVVIKILDINDNPPVFSPSHYETKLDESLPQGQIVTRVSASDADDPNSPNGTFTFKISSVTPKTDNVEFYIIQTDNIGTIYFKGCLDYKKAPKYILMIKAKDNGSKVQLSNTCTVVLDIIDKNNNMPEITGHTGPGIIKERESGVDVLSLQVNDNDKTGSPAWKATFTLHGDPDNYFAIRTDPQTNEGILSVIKAMDYEEQTSRNVSISVENEDPYFSCHMKTHTQGDFQDIETSGILKLYSVTITVVDVNDPPEFIPPVKELTVMENTKIGTLIDTLTVLNQDTTYGKTSQYFKEENEYDWVNVDLETGHVTVTKIMDRESPLLNQSTYSVIVYAVNEADPPLTGTGTLIIHLADENDNMPQLVENSVTMCLSDKKPMANISATDRDLPPYSAPFHYDILDDDNEVEGKWKIKSHSETSAYLFKENTVHAGQYTIRIKISDNQGYGSVQNLFITVCDCTNNPNCHVRRIRSQPSFSGIWIMLLALLLLLVMLLMVCPSWKKKNMMIPMDDVSGTLVKDNTEAPGTDCKDNIAIVPNLLSSSAPRSSRPDNMEYSTILCSPISTSTLLVTSTDCSRC